MSKIIYKRSKNWNHFRHRRVASYVSWSRRGTQRRCASFQTTTDCTFPKKSDVFFTAYLTAEMAFRSMQTILRKDIFTDSNFELYQSIRTLVTRKGLEKEKEENFRVFLTMLLEMGHPTHFRRDLPDFLGMELAPRGDKEAPKIYWGLPDSFRVHHWQYPCAGPHVQPIGPTGQTLFWNNHRRSTGQSLSLLRQQMLIEILIENRSYNTRHNGKHLSEICRWRFQSKFAFRQTENKDGQTDSKETSPK